MSLFQSPPALFKQESTSRINFFAAIIFSVLLIGLDSKYSYLDNIRSGFSYLLSPVIQFLLLPRDIYISTKDKISTVSSLNQKIEELENNQRINAKVLLKLNQLERENIDLRKLLDLKSSLNSPSINAEVRYELPDIYSNKVVINQGTNSDITIGLPVISASGVVGQVSKVYFKSAEITLVSDRNLSIPVVLPRSRIKAITRGQGNKSGFELVYADISAKLKIGDEVVTSGLDGIYPAGILVGHVSSVFPAVPGEFPKIIGKPAAIIGIQHQVMILKILNKENGS